MRNKIGLVAISLLLAVLFQAASAAGPKKSAGKWRRYLGGMFSVYYPPDFKVRAGMLSGWGPDSAFFTSPDKSVEFYVFSPQWDGEPEDIFLKPATEKLIAEKTIKEKKKLYPEDPQSKTQRYSRIIRVSIKAKDGSYTRAYEDILVNDGESEEEAWFVSRRAFGIKYTNQKAYNKYKKSYLKFKQSLEQYAD
jgi:hypothetical protein